MQSSGALPAAMGLLEKTCEHFEQVPFPFSWMRDKLFLVVVSQTSMDSLHNAYTSTLVAAQKAIDDLVGQAFGMQVESRFET